jgi:hypothetical protein
LRKIFSRLIIRYIKNLNRTSGDFPIVINSEIYLGSKNNMYGNFQINLNTDLVKSDEKLNLFNRGYEIIGDLLLRYLNTNFQRDLNDNINSDNFKELDEKYQSDINIGLNNLELTINDLGKFIYNVNSKLADQSNIATDEDTGSE